MGAMSQIFERFERNHNYNNNDRSWILLSAASHWEKKSPVMISLQCKAKRNNKWASLIAVKRLMPLQQDSKRAVNQDLIIKISSCVKK